MNCEIKTIYDNGDEHTSCMNIDDIEQLSVRVTKGVHLLLGLDEYRHIQSGSVSSIGRSWKEITIRRENEK